MKRSELQAIIQEYIDHQEYHEFGVYSGTILDMIEKAGMLPPNNGTYSSRHSHDEFLYVEEVYDWEPEDE